MFANSYNEVIQYIERLHRRFLDVVQSELDRHKVTDINNVQAMILYNIAEDDMTVGELTLRGYYQGSNVSYNVTKMVENGYLIKETSVHDKRSMRVKLSEKGLKLYKSLQVMYQRHQDLLGKTDMSQEKLQQMNNTFKQLERFWASQSAFAGLDDLE